MLYSPEVAEALYPSRSTEANEWAYAALQVGRLASTHEVELSLRFLTTRVGLAIPFEDQVRVYPPAGDEEGADFATIMPLFIEDAERLAPSIQPLPRFLAAVARGEVSHLGTYIRNSKSILVNKDGITRNCPTRMSTVSRGATLLHELRHARKHIEERVAHTDELDEWLEEAEVNVGDFEIAQELGGRRYKKLVKKTLAATKLIEDGTMVEHGEVDADDLRKTWEKACGEPLLAAELRHWEYQTRVHAYWLFCLRHADEPHREFARFLQNRRTADVAP